MTAQEFWNQGCIFLKNESNSRTGIRRFRSMFGCTHFHCETIWNLLMGRHPPYSHPRHLLMALLFLKVYSTEEIHHAISGADEKTFRKWSWIYTSLIAKLNVVS